MTKLAALLLLCLASTVQASDWCYLRRDLNPVVLECPSKTHTVQVVDWPLIVIDERVSFDVSPGAPKLTARQRREIERAKLPGVIDACEAPQVALYCGQSALDAATMFKAAACAGVREANPLIGGPVAGVVIQAAGCAYVRWDAKRTHQFDSSCKFLKRMNVAKAFVNAVSLASLSGAGCL